MVRVDEQPAAVDYYIGAHVEVAPDVVIAAGAVLEAAPGARLVVAAGVCVGAGVIIQAAGGKLTIDTGASLGVGVLLVGQGVVNANACIGAESTLINPRVEAGAVIPARSLLGVPTPKSSDRPPATANGHAAAPDVPPPTTPDSGETPSSETTPSPTPSTVTPGESPPANGTAKDSTPAAEVPDGAATAETTVATSPAPARVVYGREQVTRLMKTLFPHRDALNDNGDSNLSDSS